MRILLLLATVLCLGCNTHSDTSKIADSVRAFTQAVAHDVSRDGPAAWRGHFADDPSFFMAVNGRMEFASGAAMVAAMPGVARAIPQIELQWGNDLRVDPLASDLAVVAAPYREILTMADGQRAEVSGFFTGVAQLRGGRWQFRDAHWSSPLAAIR